jgi:predicted ArsR family transcriptional regulator
MKITAKEVAEHLGIDYVVASGLMTALVDKGIAKHVENRKHASGKGKPTRVFEVNQTITLELFSTPKAAPVVAAPENTAPIENAA